jgi:hypothetical protein
MTSMAFILGVVPLITSVGAGSEMRKTLGIAVFSGMLGVTLFGIFLTPVFYYVIQWASDRRSEARRRAGLPTDESEEYSNSDVAGEGVGNEPVIKRDGHANGDGKATSNGQGSGDGDALAEDHAAGPRSHSPAHSHSGQH